MTRFHSEPFPWEPTKRKPVKKPAPVKHEDSEQAAFVQWMRLQYPQHRIFAIPNGGSRHPGEARNLKRQGVSPGVPDLMIPDLQLFIEMKRAKGYIVSDEQKDWHDYLRKAGYRVEICKGCEEAMKVIREITNGKMSGATL